ncbi:MAG: tetratricopeptide repeat protein [Proteobacteria bacterium]|nr:tetratricopeptide repeat protein [Pseudomonadota bacterium]
MKTAALRRLFAAAAIALAATLSPVMHAQADAQENWSADDDSFEARKIERYQQLVDQSPEKSYAFNQLMATVGKGAAYQKLIADYEKKVQNKPGNFNLRMILGHIYQHGGRTNEAIGAYTKALEIKKTALAYMSIAAAEAENRNFDPAVSAYEAAAALNPTTDQKKDIYRALAEIALYRRDMPRAQQNFEKLIALEPNSLFLRRELSQIYTQNKLYADARRTLEDAQKLPGLSGGDREQLELDIAELYEEEGNDKEALARYESLSAKLPASHWMQRELTARIIDIHRRSGDIKALASTLEKRWKSPTYQQHLELADLYDETNEPEKALAHLKKAVASSPKLPEGHEKLIAFYRSHGQTDNMIEARKALIKAVPDNPDYRFALYDAYIQQKQTDKALAVLDETVKKFPDFDVQRKAAEYYQLNGRNQKALDIYEGWVKKHPGDLDALEALGDQYDTAGQHKKAVETWQKIENLPLDKATKLESLARIYDEHGYADEAEALYKKALAASPKDCQAHTQYADSLTRNGKQLEAIEAWKKLAQTCQNAPARTLATRQLASLYQTRGMKQAALDQHREASVAAKATTNDLLIYASLAEQLGAPQQAIPTLEAYVQAHPKDTEVLTALNQLQAASGDLTAARNTLQKLSSLSETERRDALIAMAELDIRDGDLQSAQTHLSDALQLNANDADTYEKLGDVQFKRRLYEDAAASYDTAFQIDSRNYHVAFKSATCHSITGKTAEADALYVQIVTKATDETLAHKAAQRAIDDHAWLGTLDALANEFLPLLRSKQRKELYLEILLSLADAQSQPHILALQAQDAPLSARHALRQLSDKYAGLLVESLLSSDPAISARGLTLAQWLVNASTIAALGQVIEKAPTTETGRLTQLQAVKAIAHAQLPAAVPVLRSCLEAHHPRALREHALWALGLIQAKTATDELKAALDTNLDTFRALAVIGLARNHAELTRLHSLLTADPAPLVRQTAAWALAANGHTKAYPDIPNNLNGEISTPLQLWIMHRIDAATAPAEIFKALWGSDPDMRTQAARLMRTKPADAALTDMTLTEIQGRMIHGTTTHYQSNFDISMLLQSLSDLITEDTGTSADYIAKHEDAFLNTVSHTALNGDTAAKTLMLSDMAAESGTSFADPKIRPILTRAATAISPQLDHWTAQSDSAKLTRLSLRVLALTHTQDALKKIQAHAENPADIPLRINAIDALAAFDTDDSRRLLRKYATDSAYLIRATAIQHLDPANPEDKQVLQNALNDDYALVAKTAAARLN